MLRMVAPLRTASGSSAMAMCGALSRPGFVNLAESVAGFGDTQDKAEADLLRNEEAA
ncbi:hypothetical protein AB5I41_31670 [Sphingomonas sp. MMS24-JH45]